MLKVAVAIAQILLLVPRRESTVLRVLCRPQDMGRVEGKWIAGALIPAALIAILFYFDHNVSSQLAQQVPAAPAAAAAGHTKHLVTLASISAGCAGIDRAAAVCAPVRGGSGAASASQ
jgi:hypothetical protein